MSPKPRKDSFTRREFLKSGAAAAAAGLGGTAFSGSKLFGRARAVGVSGNQPGRS